MKERPTLWRILEIGGIVAGAIMVAFGVAAIYMGFDGRSTVQVESRQQVHRRLGRHEHGRHHHGDQQGHPARPEADCSRAREGRRRPDRVHTRLAPSCSVAGEAVDNGTDARCFAEYLRLHALRSTSGLTYSQMGRYVAKDDAPPAETDFAGGTSNAAVAEIDAKTNQPLDNGSRELWVTATALFVGPQSCVHRRADLALRHCGRLRAAAHGHRPDHSCRGGLAPPVASRSDGRVAERGGQPASLSDFSRGLTVSFTRTSPAVSSESLSRRFGRHRQATKGEGTWVGGNGGSGWESRSRSRSQPQA